MNTQITLYRGDQVCQVEPLKAPHWLADGWSLKAPESAIAQPAIVAAASNDIPKSDKPKPPVKDVEPITVSPVSDR